MTTLITTNKLTIMQGNDLTLPVTFTQVDGTPLNLTGSKVYFTVKKANDPSNNDDNAILQKDTTVHTDPTAGETNIVIAASVTRLVTPGEYVYDLQVKDGFGYINSTIPLPIIILPDVTKRYA